MTLDLIFFMDAREFLFPLILGDVEAAGQPPACGVIKTLGAEQPLLGGWQWFNELRAPTGCTRSSALPPRPTPSPNIHQQSLLTGLLATAGR